MVELVCQGCGKSFESKRRDRKFCDATCRQRGHRRGGKPAAVTGLGKVAPIVAAVRRELEVGERLDSALGQQALALAEQIASGYQSGSAIATLSRELRAVMAEALADAPRADDALDELAKRREAKAAGA